MGRVCTSAAGWNSPLSRGKVEIRVCRAPGQRHATPGDRMDMGHQICFLLITKLNLMQEDFPLARLAV